MFIDGESFGGDDRDPDWTEFGSTPKAMRTIGLWPADAFDTLMYVLEERIAQESDPRRRRSLQQVRDGLIDVGKGVASGVLTAVMRAGIGV